MKHLSIVVTVTLIATQLCGFMPKDAKIYIAGHRGLVGSALVRSLKEQGYHNLVVRSSTELDLTNQQAVNQFFEEERPEYVFLSAAKVGGIKANMDYPAEFIYSNLSISTNVIHASYLYGVKKLLYLGSSCIYPRNCPQPIKEEYLLTSELEKTNEAYAIAKIAGLKMCEYYNKQYGTNFIACMPTNLYGPEDNFDLENSHVLPALIARMYNAKITKQPTMRVWGTGKAFREFLYVDDLAQACVFLMNTYKGNELVNIGSGEDVTISQLANAIKEILGYEGELVFDTSKPDGTPRKLLDISFMRSLGWQPQVSLDTGLRMAIEWYVNNFDAAKRK